MGSNNGDSTIVSRNDPIECSGTTVEIKIKTLDSQTYTLRVDKCVSVPALKEQVAIVTGVLSEQQRLICRGKVLKDDQLLSAYHVEDGHTLHLVVRQPSPQPTNLPDGLATDRMPSADNGRGGVVVGSFNISEQGEGAFPDLSRIVSAVLGSFGLSNIGSDRGVDLREPTSDRDQGTPYGFRDFSGHQSDQAATVGQPNPLNGSPSAPFTIAFPLESQHPPVIPDSLSTLSLYLTHLRNEFALIARGADGSSRTAGAHRNNVPASSAASSAPARHGGLPTPASLADVLLSARQLLIEQAAECLLQLREQLANHENIADTSARTSIQSSAIRLGSLLQNLGALLLELGRTTTTLRMGATPAEAVVNAGPAVFISTAGPNPIMVQPLSFQSGSNFGAIPMANLQPNSVLPGVSPGSAFLPRNIDIRIRRGSLMSTSVVSQREPSLAMQSSGQPVPEAASAGGISVTESAPRASTPSSREPEVRIVPIRTVVAAVPANITQTPSDSSNSPMGLFYPILARVQHVASANRDEAGSSQVSNEHLPSGTDGERSPTFGSVGQPLYGANHLASESQTNLGFASGTHGRFDQLLRTIFPGEQSQFGSNANIQGETTGYNALQAVTTGATVATQNVESTVSDEGTFLSNLLHQIMPFIAQNVEMCPTTTENQDRSPRNNLQTSFSQDEQNLDAGTSHSQAGPSTPPCAKRQKRE